MEDMIKCENKFPTEKLSLHCGRPMCDSCISELKDEYMDMTCIVGREYQ